MSRDTHKKLLLPEDKTSLLRDLEICNVEILLKKIDALFASQRKNVYAFSLKEGTTSLGEEVKHTAERTCIFALRSWTGTRDTLDEYVFCAMQLFSGGQQDVDLAIMTQFRILTCQNDPLFQ